ncbi:hypothetical protein HPP92_010396 [Vanilla planifolia]|uniref:CCT domain-containing protein n=1 Tax=Vanilla planifolia TaxID=51239 RepID=A0A835R414_VANPL|nr:hypothetical protein HPP92_010396 [Vanilla planifolia]
MGSSPQSYNPYRLEPVRYQFQEPGSPVSMQNPFSTRKSRKALTASWKPFHEPQSKAKENNWAIVRKEEEEKKWRKEEAKEKKVDTSNSSPEGGTFKAPLSLKLNYDDILKNWSGGSPFSGEDGSPESAAERGGEEREASLQRYKEKRRNRLFSKKIRYEVRKVNADQRPRVKASGRFVRVSSLLQEASLDERR